MAYKKYIEKNGKIYGPYIYHSKRVDGKVVSEYHGVKEKKESVSKIPKEVKSRRTLVFGVGVVVVLAFVFWTIFFQSQFSGRVVLDIEGAGVEGELISGNMNLLLRPGELVPIDTIVRIENGGSFYEYYLYDLVEENPISDSFYLEGSDVVGEGEGYGIIGIKEEISPVFFQFELIEGETASGGSESPSPEGVPSNGEDDGKEPLEEIPIEGEVPAPDQVVLEESASSDEPEGEVPAPEIVPSDEPEPEEEPETSPGITGNIVGGVGSLFRGSFTGRVIDENLVQGDVSQGQEFRYNIPSDMEVKIIEGSIRTEDEDLSLDVLDVQIVGGELIVTTDYSSVKEGFGEEYLGEEEIYLSMPLTELGIVFVPGPILVTGTYGEIEIFTVEGDVSSEFIEVLAPEGVPSDESEGKEPEEPLPTINETENVTNITLDDETLVANLTINETKEVEDLILTEEEKNVLKEVFAMVIVETTAKNYRDKVLVEFSLGDYILEHYYDENLSQDELMQSIDKDRIIWLKDLAREFSKELESSEEILELKEIYPVI